MLTIPSQLAQKFTLTMPQQLLPQKFRLMSLLEAKTKYLRSLKFGGSIAKLETKTKLIRFCSDTRPPLLPPLLLLKFPYEPEYHKKIFRRTSRISLAEAVCRECKSVLWRLKMISCRSLIFKKSTAERLCQDYMVFLAEFQLP